MEALPNDMRIFRFAVFTFWAFTIITAWIATHLQNPHEPWWFLLSPLLLLPFLFGGVLLLRQQRFLWWTKLSPIVLAGLVFLLSLLLLNVASFLRISPLSHERVLPFDFWFTAQGGFFIHLIILIATLGLSALSLYLTGHLLSYIFLRSTFWKSSPISFCVLWKIALGMFGWILLSFTLGIWGILSSPLVLWCVLGIFLIERKELPLIWKWLTTPLLIVRVPNKASLALILFCFFVIALGLVDAIRPIPTGYDDMTSYMNRVNLMVSYQTLATGGAAFPFELLAATTQTAVPIHGLLSGMSFGVLCFLLGGYTLYCTGKHLWNQRVGFIAVALWMSLPMTSALFLREVKPDILLFFIAGLSFWAWIQWLEKHNVTFLYQSAFLLGFAISIKYTGLFLGGAFLASFLWEKWHARITKGTLSIRNILFAVGFTALPLLPWLGYNLASHPTNQRLHLESFTQSTTPHPILTDTTWKKFGINPETTCRPTGTKEEFARFHFHQSHLLQIFLTPWGITMNTRLGYFATEIGFLFLVILPVFLFFPKKKEGVNSSHRVNQFSTLSALAIGYFAFWFLLAQSIPWYGFPGFFLLIFLVTLAFVVLAKERSFFWILSLILLLGLATNLMVRLKFSLAPVWLQYSSTKLDERGFIETLLPGFSPVASLVNQDEHTNILIAGSGIRYFVMDNDRRVLADPMLDTFACLNHENNPSLTRKRLQALGIRHLYLSVDRLDPNLQAQYPTLKEKTENFLSFAESTLTLRLRTPLGFLYEVPK